MKIDGEALARLFLPGGLLDGATIHSVELYGENYADGSADGCEIFMMTRRGGFALLQFDALDSEMIATRFLAEELQSEAEERDRRRIAELEARAAEIRAQYPALQAIHAKCLLEAAQRRTLDGMPDG